jgi:endonuclease YncB( thermonuclease family)
MVTLSNGQLATINLIKSLGAIANLVNGRDKIAAGTYNCRVTWVHDGDTCNFQLEDGRQGIARLLDIDAPELSQPYGKESRDMLILAHEQINCVDIAGVDKYNRYLCSFYSNAISTNLLMVKHGAAWWFAKYSHNEKYMNAEKDARGYGRGLWALPNPIAPWDWRSGIR